MKKYLITLLALVAAMTASAQFRWGATVGVNINDFLFRQKLFDDTSKTGVTAGVTGELMFPGPGFGLDIALLYNMHCSKLNLGQQVVWSSEGYGNETLRMHTLQIPVNLKFKYTNLNGIERIIAPLVYAGPIISFTLAHSKLPALEYAAAHLGLQCGIGAEIKEKVQITAGYYWGMTYEVRTVKLSNISGRPKGWSVKATYFF